MPATDATPAPDHAWVPDPARAADHARAPDHAPAAAAPAADHARALDELPDFAEEVLALVEQIPPGRVMSYGAVAECLGHGGPRQVGSVMSRYGGAVPWHRVVNSAGRVVPGHEVEALRRLRQEGTPLRGDRVDMRRASWFPPAL